MHRRLVPFTGIIPGVDADLFPFSTNQKPPKEKLKSQKSLFDAKEPSNHACLKCP